MSALPYVVPETSPDYEADDINDALRAACSRIEDSPSRNAACADNGPDRDLALQLAAEDAEAERIEAERIPCRSCRVYTVEVEGERCVACAQEFWGDDWRDPEGF